MDVADGLAGVGAAVADEAVSAFRDALLRGELSRDQVDVADEGCVLRGEVVRAGENAGTYRVNWGPHNLASGIYFIRIQAGQFISVQKCMMMK